MPVRPKFLVDAMLGTLARKLRFLGFDATFMPHVDDKILIKTANEEQRTILTKDTELSRCKKSDIYYVKGEDVTQQIRELVGKFGLILDNALFMTRCPECNGTIAALPKEKAKGRVPPLAFSVFDEFSECISCGKTYWKGSHFEVISSGLKEILDGQRK